MPSESEEDIPLTKRKKSKKEKKVKKGIFFFLYFVLLSIEIREIEYSCKNVLVYEYSSFLISSIIPKGLVE